MDPLTGTRELSREKNVGYKRRELKNEKNINYEPLESLLAQGEWQKADQKTSKLMLQAMNKNSWFDVSKQDLLNFPVTDLRTMDRLWVHYSNGKFGFSVQKQIWIDCGGIVGEYKYDIGLKFSDRVGWRKNNSWLSFSQFIFSTKSPSGHLPRSGYKIMEGLGNHGIPFLSSRL